VIAKEQKEAGYKGGCSEKRINREQVLCQRWGAMKEREDTPPGGESPEGYRGRMGGGGGPVYLGAELGCLIPASIMAALNKPRMRCIFTFTAAALTPWLFEGMQWVDRSTLGVDVRGQRTRGGDQGPQRGT